MGGYVLGVEAFGLFAAHYFARNHEFDGDYFPFALGCSRSFFHVGGFAQLCVAARCLLGHQVSFFICSSSASTR
jgi:hypothetical protein